jgi:hypothetical protein
MPRVEHPAERRARHADTARSAVVAMLAVIGLAVAGVRGLGLLVTALLAGGASVALQSARRAQWDWGVAVRILLAYGAATVVLWIAARALGYR